MSDHIHIVYLTRGEYSDFGVVGIMVGRIDPAPALDAHVAAATAGRWAKWEQEPHCPFKPLTPESGEFYEAMRMARAGVPDLLKGLGFEEADAVEVWLG